MLKVYLVAHPSSYQSTSCLVFAKREDAQAHADKHNRTSIWKLSVIEKELL